ncbi:MAG TPA: VWA domain-containing protein [Gemmatimonadetes bacterium]|nr:VWA domain-containing protein [Gemmatimonadota bacterium]
MSFAFAQPGWLILLATVPVWVWWVTPKGSGAMLVASGTEAKRVSIRAWIGRALELAPLLLRGLGVTAIIVGLAQPQVIETFEEPVAEGVGIAVAIDLSSSMGARDLSRRASRMQAAKLTILGFLGDRTDDVGVISFGGEALTRMPLTHDYYVVRYAIEDLDSRLLLDGTDIAAAITAGAGLLRDAPHSSKILILVTDGAHNGQGLDPARAARAAAAFGVRIYPIAIGTDYMLRDQIAEMETVLTQAAFITGGRYFRATDVDALEEVYEEIDRLAAPSQEIVERTEATPIGLWVLLASLPVLLLGAGLRGSRWGVLP